MCVTGLTTTATSLGYPARVEPRLAILSQAKLHESARQEHLPVTFEGKLQSFLQNWLFFGLIHEILGHYVDAQDPVRDSGVVGASSKVLSTAVIPDALQRWAGHMKAGLANSAKSCEHILRCLQLTYLNLKAAASAMNPELVLCLASLGDMFNHAIVIFSVHDELKMYDSPAPWRDDIHGGYWEAKMVSIGLCPSKIRMVCKMATTVQTLFFASHLLQLPIPQGHDKCAEHTCSAYNNSLESYQTRHVTSQCACKHLEIELGDLEHILEDGHLPLVRIRPGRTLAELSLDLVSTRDFPAYVALSHVWAEGLGNPRENALPRCQLVYLRETVDSMRPLLEMQEDQELLFWCDTLCCPARDGAAKNLALRGMKIT